MRTWIWWILLVAALLQPEAVQGASKLPAFRCISGAGAPVSNLTTTSLAPSRAAHQFNIPKSTRPPRKTGRPAGQGKIKKVGPVGRPRRTKAKATNTKTSTRPRAPKTRSKTNARTKVPKTTQTQKPRERPGQKDQPRKPKRKSQDRHRASSKHHSRTKSRHGRKSTRPAPGSSAEPTSIPPSSILSSAASSSIRSLASVVASPLPKTPWPRHKVIGYYSYHHSATMPPESLPWNQLTHVVFAFGSLESTYNITIPTKGQVTVSALFAAAKANGVKTVLSVGGWRGSAYFSEMVASNSSRLTFISSARNIIQQYDLDGIDIDWEYPGRPGDVGTPYNEITDVPNLLLLIQQMRQTLGWRVELSAALSSSKPWSSDVREFAQLLDYGSIMSYNFAGRGQIKSGAMAPLEGSASVSSGAMNWNNAGWPWHKLAMGIPGYGRSWTLEDPNSPLTMGLRNPVTTVIPQGDNGQRAGSGVWRWRNLVSQSVLVPHGSTPGAYTGGTGWEQGFDEDTKSPYVWNNSTGEFISYDDPVSVSYKREWARERGMVGLMIWQVPFDRDGGELLTYMN